MALWLVFVAVCFVGGNQAGLNESENDDTSIGEYGRSVALYNEGDFPEEPTENVIITARGGAFDKAAAIRAADDALARFRVHPEVARVDGPLEAPNGAALLVRI